MLAAIITAKPPASLWFYKHEVSKNTDNHLPEILKCLCNESSVTSGQHIKSFCCSYVSMAQFLAWNMNQAQICTLPLSPFTKFCFLPQEIIYFCIALSFLPTLWINYSEPVHPVSVSLSFMLCTNNCWEVSNRNEEKDEQQLIMSHLFSGCVI